MKGAIGKAGVSSRERALKIYSIVRLVGIRVSRLANCFVAHEAGWMAKY